MSHDPALVGVTLSHGEHAHPGRIDFTGLFAHLERAGARVETLRAALTQDALADLGALVVGAPSHPLQPGELDAVAAWVETGGRLLVLGGPLDDVVQQLVPEWRLGPRPSRLRELLGSRVARGVHVGEREELFARATRGRGWVGLVGDASLLNDDSLASIHEQERLEQIVREWLPGLVPLELAKRQRRPQRHRLLHGYPMAPLMAEVGPDRDVPEGIGISARPRGLTVGVLPHPFCNPTVRGCGFCTFPHQDYNEARAQTVVASVIKELDDLWIPPAHGHLEGEGPKRPVTALYFGGATANLTPAESFTTLVKRLAERFDLSSSEITLEGVPRYFVTKPLLSVLKESVPTKRLRVSMGVQTFDGSQLARMGRTVFGDRAAVEEALKVAKDQGYTVSGDLLFDLPGQTLEQMRQDVDTAVALGFDQLCLYHLVLAPELGTEWSKDAELLASIPTNDRACANWLDLRERLLAAGFVQTTLTNFERKPVHESDRRFIYEECGFDPDAHDTVGLGPSALSLLKVWADMPIKLMNSERATEYMAAVARRQPAERYFIFTDDDLEVLHFTRRIARLAIDRLAFAERFRADVTQRFDLELAACERAGLVTIDEARVALTPRGMFYADSVAGLIAAPRVRLMRLRGERRKGKVMVDDPNVAAPGPMG